MKKITAFHNKTVRRLAFFIYLFSLLLQVPFLCGSKEGSWISDPAALIHLLWPNMFCDLCRSPLLLTRIIMMEIVVTSWVSLKESCEPQGTMATLMGSAMMPLLAVEWTDWHVEMGRELERAWWLLGCVITLGRISLTVILGAAFA